MSAAIFCFHSFFSVFLMNIIEIYLFRKECFMKHIHFFQHCCVPHDVPVEHYDINGIFAAMMGTTKHCMLGCNSDAGLREAFKMVVQIAGGETQLRARPLFSISACMLISPLKFCTQSTKNVRQAAQLGVPTTVTSAPMSGSTSPKLCVPAWSASVRDMSK